MPLRVGERTIGDHLKENGIKSVLVGKTHMVADAEGNVSVTHMESHDTEMLALPAAPSDRRTGGSAGQHKTSSLETLRALVMNRDFC